MTMLRQLLWLALLAPLWARAAEVPIADFVRDGGVVDVQISPDGTYLSKVRRYADSDYLLFIDIQTQQVSGGLKLDRDRRVARHWWVGPGRVVLMLAEQFGPLAQPESTGELLALDADKAHGTGLRYLFGFRDTATVTGSNIRVGHDAVMRYAKVIGQPLPGGRQAAIEVNDFSGDEQPEPGEVDLLDVYSGDRKVLARAPKSVQTEFLVDDAGQPRYALGLDNELRLTESYVKVDGEAEWKRLDQGALKGASIVPEALSSDGQRVFLLSNEGGDRFCVVEERLDNGARRKLSCDGAADAEDLVLSFDRKEPVAALYPGAPPWERVLDTTHPDAARLKSLMQAFPGQVVRPVSVTADGAKAVVETYSDRNPGDYYLFDTKTMKAALIASRQEWIDPEQMSERQPLEFKARDGQSIHALLTLPRGAGKNLPLVVNPHGGPADVMDHWRWEPEPQLLASRGYAVLQVNYRGSGGYGAAFQAAGRQAWDSLMIDDVTDGVRSLIKQGVVDPGRICIYGASYGGYAALISAEREPDLYRCAVGYAGVYDLNRLKSEDHLRDTQRGRNYFANFIGDNPERLRQASPVSHIDRLKAALMLVHGEEDDIAPVSQFKAMRKALDAAHYPYEWMLKPNEGHGFYEEKNRLELYDKLLAFLARNIGPQAGKVTPEAAGAQPAGAAGAPATQEGASGG